MTPEEKAYAAAWWAEMGKLCPEYHQTAAERANAWSRQQGVNGAGEKAPAASTERESA